MKPGVGFSLHKQTIPDISGIVGGHFGNFRPPKKKKRDMSPTSFFAHKEKRPAKESDICTEGNR